MAFISIYKINTAVEVSNWQAAWAVVENSYGIDAILRNIFESQASVEDETLALRAACEMQTNLASMQLREQSSDATHAFVQSENGNTKFGLDLNAIFREV